MNRKKIIKKIIDLCFFNKEGHIGSSLSVLDILYVLYQNYITDFSSEDRNRCILSKGHSSAGLYAILDEFGLLEENINNFCKFNSLLGGHPSDKLKTVEASTGSLGHGLPIAIGFAIGYKIQNYKNKIFVIIGDGEMNEGSIWESLLLAAHHQLNNLICILDYNRSNDKSLKLDNIFEKITAFNWNCVEINGHNLEEIKESLSTKHSFKPTFIIANTTKGKGISFMENNPEWHHKMPNEDEYDKILKELL
jgi:transketolase